MAKERTSAWSRSDRVVLGLLRAGQTVGDERHRVVVGLERQLLLGAEVVVDAALLEAGRVDEVAHRGADVALLVEHGRRQLDDPLAGGRTLGVVLGVTAELPLEKTDRSV